jgi:hypothetical protein
VLTQNREQPVRAAGRRVEPLNRGLTVGAPLQVFGQGVEFGLGKLAAVKGQQGFVGRTAVSHMNLRAVA